MARSVFSNRNIEDIPIGVDGCRHDVCVNGGHLEVQDDDCEPSSASFEPLNMSMD